MMRTASVLWLAPVFLAAAVVRAAQAPPAQNPAANNPHLGNPESIRGGMTLYRVRCADCHGLDATGYRGPDLIGLLAGGATDERIFQTIRNGVPGTEMPSSKDPDNELLMIIAYLRKMGSATAAERPVGNVDNGARLFASQCASCHRVAGRGGRLGPELTRIGASRSRAALIREIRTPSEWIAPTFETVTLVTKDGRRIRGAKKNEDVFSVQVMDTRERIQGFLKSNLQQVVYEKESLMPAFAPSRLNDADLTDLVGYLSSLRGTDLTAARDTTPPSAPVTAEDLHNCCGAVNRGFGVLGDRLYMATIDAHLVALDMKSGGVLFDVPLADYKVGYSATVAPLVIKDKVIVGIAGAEFGIRGFIDAYDAKTGARAWRFYTVAGPDEPGGNTWPKGEAYMRGGGSIWVTGTYDPQQNLIFFGTGNPGPDYYSNAREGDNLYTASLVALDA